MVSARVRIDGLNARPELNGRYGVAKTYVKEKGRFAVAFEGEEEGSPPVEQVPV